MNVGRRNFDETTFLLPSFQRNIQLATGVIHIERTKFNVDKDKEKRSFDGIVFDSVLEMKYYRDVVCPMLESGDLVECERQKPYVLQPKFIRNGKTVLPINYVADFRLVYKDGHEEVIDTKGCPDSVAKMKRKMFWYVYPDIDYRWICYSKIDGGWQEYEYVKQQRALRKRDKKLQAI